jgi:hypothetical protein
MKSGKWRPIEDEPEHTLRYALYCMSYGSLRRKAILERMEGPPFNGRIPVNRSHTCQIKKDPDLRFLIKRGTLVLKNGTPQYLVLKEA